MEGWEGDGSKSTLQKTFGQGTKGADSIARTCRKTYKAGNSKQRNCFSLLPLCFKQEKTPDFAQVKKLDYNKKKICCFHQLIP